MKIGFSYRDDVRPDEYKLTVDKDTVEELIKVSERNMNTAVQGKRYGDLVAEVHNYEALTDLLKEPEVPELDKILTE